MSSWQRSDHAQAMSTISRYLMLQVPGGLLVAGLLWWTVTAGHLRAVPALLIFAVWVLKDVLLYPAFRHAAQPAPAAGGKAFVGHEVTLLRDAAPRGLVQLGGELWSVRPRQRTLLRAGTRVRIVDAQGLVLIAEPAERRQ